jgi:hypothetical protein
LNVSSSYASNPPLTKAASLSLAGTLRILGLVAGWAWAIFAGVGVAVATQDGNIPEGMFLPLSAAVALPPVNSYLERRWHLALAGWLRFVIIVVLMVTAASLDTHDDSSTPSRPSAKDVQRSSGPSTTSARTLMDLYGSGTKTTARFTTGDWDLRYFYDCSTFGEEGDFQVFIYDTDASISFTNSGVDERGKGGSEVDHYHSTGTFYLEVNSECSWHLQISG